MCAPAGWVWCSGCMTTGGSQNGLFESASTMRPTAWSLSATIDAGVGLPRLVPSVWFTGRVM